MPQELIYTSAPHGLSPGSGGFCTVAHTSGMSPQLVAFLESLSAYRHIFPPQSESAALNPVSWSHLSVRSEGTMLHILSRIADAGLDYTKRSNLIAHHLVLRPEELPPCGPAWILLQPQLFRTHWEGRPMELPPGPAIPSVTLQAKKCVRWEKLTGDAAWGGALAETALKRQPACLLFEPGTDLLPLLAESIALLPESERWKPTFNTYLSEQGSKSCLWKCLRAGTPEALAQSSVKGTLVIDLTRPLAKVPGSSSLIALARSGRVSAPQRVTQTQEDSPGLKDEEAPPQKRGPSVQPGAVEVPPIQGDTYGLIVEPPTKRKRPRTGPWSKEYESNPLEAEKARKEFRLFVSIMVVAILGILVLLTLIGDEVFNNGGIRKSVTQIFSSPPQEQPPEPNENQPPPQPQPQPQPPPEDNVTEKEEPAPEPPPEEPENPPLSEEEQLTPEEERLAKEQELLEQKQREEAAERLRVKKENMRAAFVAIPDFFELAEPKSKAFGGVELTNQLCTEFAPLYPFREQVRLRWFAMATPRGWIYRLDRIPQQYTDDPARWNLVVQNLNTSRELLLCSIFLKKEGLQFEWHKDTAGVETNFELVNKLPFGYLRVGLGPAFDLEHLPKGFTRNTAEFSPANSESQDESEDNETVSETEIEIEDDLYLDDETETPEEIVETPVFNPDWMSRPYETLTPEVVSQTDFTTTPRFRDVRLLIPFTSAKVNPVGLNERSGMNRPSDPVEKVTNIFGSDRWRYGLENLDVQESFLFDLRADFLTPNESVGVEVLPGETPWKKRIEFTSDVLTSDGNPVVLAMTAEANVSHIEFRDNYFQERTEAGEYRTVAKTIKKKEEQLQSYEAEPKSEENEKRNTALRKEIDALEKERVALQDRFQKLAAARKKLFAAGPIFNFSLQMKGDTTADLPLLSTEKEKK